jgi:hypothetical protein
VSDGEPVLIASYPDTITADLVKGRLEAEGVSAFVADENTATSLSGIQAALGGVRLYVAAGDAEAAREVIANLSYPLGTAAATLLEAEVEEAAAEPVPSPEPASAEDRASARLLWVVVAVVALLAVGGFLLSRWNREPREEPNRPAPRLPAPFR